jgi:hypothetical protein
MHYPEVLLIPVLMLADYYLTVFGAVLGAKAYRQHFRTENYELNPLWQQDIARKRWLNPRHLFLTLVVSVTMLIVTQTVPPGDGFVELLLGAVLVMFACIIGRHLTNIATYAYAVRFPDGIRGQVEISPQTMLVLSLFQSLVVGCPLLMIALLSPSPFALGGLIGVLLLVVVQLFWLRRSTRRRPPVSDAR